MVASLVKTNKRTQIREEMWIILGIVLKPYMQWAMCTVFLSEPFNLTQKALLSRFQTTKHLHQTPRLTLNSLLDRLFLFQFVCTQIFFRNSLNRRCSSIMI
jgi:hypothetical protein